MLTTQDFLLCCPAYAVPQVEHMHIGLPVAADFSIFVYSRLLLIHAHTWVALGPYVGFGMVSSLLYCSSNSYICNLLIFTYAFGGGESALSDIEQGGQYYFMHTRKETSKTSQKDA